MINLFCVEKYKVSIPLRSDFNYINSNKSTECNGVSIPLRSDFNETLKQNLKYEDFVSIPLRSDFNY